RLLLVLRHVGHVPDRRRALAAMERPAAFAAHRATGFRRHFGRQLGSSRPLARPLGPRSRPSLCHRHAPVDARGLLPASAAVSELGRGGGPGIRTIKLRMRASQGHLLCLGRSSPTTWLRAYIGSRKLGPYPDWCPRRENHKRGPFSAVIASIDLTLTRPCFPWKFHRFLPLRGGLPQP